MPTPYERYVKGWERARQAMSQRKQLGFEERGLGLREEEFGLREQRFGLEQAQWPAQKALMEARTEELGRPSEPSGELEHWLSQNPGKTVTDYWKERLGIQAQFQTQQPTAYDRDIALKKRQRLEYMNLRDMFDEGGMFTGSPRDFAKFKVLEGQFGEKAETTKIPRADIGPITALDKRIEEAPNVRMKRNSQMLRSKLMRQQHATQGLPYDTSEEDNLLAILRGKNVDWVKAEAENPNLDWGYIWEQLGTK